MKKTILVTGCAGFIGSHICERFLSLGYKVIGIDNLSNGKKKNIDPRTVFIKGDINVRLHLENAFKYKPEIVIHLAANASIVKSMADPGFEIENNVCGTIEVAELCTKYGVKHLLFASSMTLYGNGGSPFKIGDPCVPTSVYGISKNAAERFCMVWGESKSLNVTALRMFNVYGPRQATDNPYQGVVSIFMGNIVNGSALSIYGDGEQTRDFVYIDDVVDAYVAVVKNKKSYGEIFNIGCGKHTSINDIARMVSSLREGTKVMHLNARPGEQRYSSADISKTTKILRWKPKIEMSEGLALTYSWAKGESK